MYGRIVDEIPEIGLPESGVLLDGTTVSNYHLLPVDVLKREGWLSCEEIKPECTESQMLVQDTVTSDGKIITITYIAVDKEISAEEALAALLEVMG